MSLIASQHTFLLYELGLLSLKAALSTRAARAPIYAATCGEHQRGAIRNSFRKVFVDIQSKYKEGCIKEKDHIDYIECVSNDISIAHATSLHNGRFRFGVCQKLINIHLKYLWVAGFVAEPPHCPIDGIVRDLASLNYDWITSDSRDEYIGAIADLRKVATTRTLSVWELEEFQRRP